MSDQVGEAFELFWKTTYKHGSKKKAGELFRAAVKREKVEPMAFAVILVNDTAARKKAELFGFDKLHITTYLSQERWKDEVPTTSTTKGGTINHAFQGQTYQSTPQNQIADFLRDDQ